MQHSHDHGAEEFMTHAHCLMFDEVLIGWALSNNVITGFCYVLLGLLMYATLGLFKSKVPFPRTFAVFATFILLCGLDHFCHAGEYVKPYYKTYFTIGSMMTVVTVSSVPLFIRVMFKLIHYKSPEEYLTAVHRYELAEERLKAMLAEAEVDGNL